MEKNGVPHILLRPDSGVQYLEQTGNRLICPGMSNVLSNGNRGARVTEVDPETQEIVFELELEDAIISEFIVCLSILTINKCIFTIKD